jgi:hypothetical protein
VLRVLHGNGREHMAKKMVHLIARMEGRKRRKIE